MAFRISQHAKIEIERRRIPLSLVESVLARPQQVVVGVKGTKVYQSQYDFDGRMYLIRVIVDGTVEPVKVVTVYRTSKIGKYWREW